jgi:UDP-sulfoquinovose synthase
MRGFIDLRDGVRGVELAVLNPEPPGERRVVNQFTEQFSVLELAQRVQRVARSFDLEVGIAHVENSRVEAEHHHHNARHSALLELGLDPRPLKDGTVAAMLDLTRRHLDRIRPETMGATITWRHGRALPVWAAAHGQSALAPLPAL